MTRYYVGDRAKAGAEITDTVTEDLRRALDVLGGELLRRTRETVGEVFDKAQAAWPVHRDPATEWHSKALKRIKRKAAGDPHPSSTGASKAALHRYEVFKPDDRIEVGIANFARHVNYVNLPGGGRAWPRLVAQPLRAAASRLAQELPRELIAPMQRAVDGGR